MLDGTTLTRVDWYEWVRQAAGEDSLVRIGGRIGVDPSTVSLWQKRAPAAKDVIAFAKAYGRSVAEALMVAYGLTADELGVQVSADPHTLSSEVLIGELRERLLKAEESAATSGRLVQQQREARRRRQRTESPEPRRNR